MKESRFTESQIIAVLKKVEAGMKVEEVDTITCSMSRKKIWISDSNTTTMKGFIWEKCAMAER